MKKLFTLLTLLLAFTMGFSQSTTVVISQVYSGGGGSGAATYKSDYIELHNVSSVSQSLDGFSLQYASATGNFTSIYTIPAGNSIAPGGYFLVATGTVGTGGADLPVTANLTGNLNLGAASGKLALASQTTALGCGATATVCTLPNAAIIDLVGWGTVSNAEGGTANAVPALSITTGAVRKNNGCTETDNNLSDFDVVTNPVPRNASSPANLCGAAVATITATPNITSLNTTVGVASAPQSYTLSATTLTPAAGNITVTPSANLEISLSSGSGFGTGAINVPYTASTLANTLIYVRVSASAPLGAIAGTVTNAGGGATTATVTVAGNVLDPEPTTQATNVAFSAIGNNGFTVNWANGNGASRIVVVRQTSAAAVNPLDGTTYSVPGSTGAGNSVVYNGTGNSVVVTGLVAGTNYTVKVYEANGTNYLLADATGNPNTTTTTGVSPVLTQVNFTSVSTPLYSASGGSSRIPVVFVATISNLTPNTTYKYYTQVATPSDFGTAATGAGNPILFDYTVNPVTYAYTASASITTAGGYGRFTTNASGSFTGTFGFVHTGNAAKFTPGTVIYPAIAVAEQSATSIQNRFALNEGITVLGFATTGGVNDGTFIKGNSSATPGNVVALWKSATGSLVGSRPLAMTLVENPTITGDAWGTVAANFIAGYDLTPGAWNTIVPNDNAEGIRLIQQFNISTIQPVGCNSDVDGTWPSGVITSDPTSGTTALQITATDAPLNTGTCLSVLPVTLLNFTATKVNRTVALKWSTVQELNSKNFVIERSSDNRIWNSIATVAAAGFSNATRNYSYVDNTPSKGINYYRLKQVDADNRAVTSAVRPVLFSEQYAITVSPNPTTDFINVYIAKNDQKTTQVIVADINGKVIEKRNTGDQLVQISTSRFAKGVYFVKVITDEQTTTQKVIVQ